MKICHVISPFLAPETSDLSIAQPITFETMRRAKRFSGLDVDLAAYPVESKDAEVIPSDFISLAVAKRTTEDVIPSTTKRKLPFIREIVSSALEASNADFLIYTNADIAIQPYFYEYVSNAMKTLDALVINRKTVVRNIDELDNLSFFYSQGGDVHPGYDCFIASRKLWEQAELDDAFIGGNWIGRVILLNMAALGDRFAIEENKQLTFHLGDDRSWLNPAMAAYHSFNNKCVISCSQKLLATGKAGNAEDLLKLVVSRHQQNKYPDIQEDLRDLMNKGKGDVPQNPIFVFGFPRSGTTLVQSLIERGAENVVTPPEMHFFNALRYLRIEDKTHVGYEDIKKLIEHLEEKIDVGDELKAHVLRLHFEISVKELFELMLKDQLHQFYPDLPDNYRWLEKTPGHAVSVGKIWSLYPKAKFIYVLRHPMFSFTSWRKNASGWGDDTDLSVEYLSGIYERHLKSALDFKKAHPDQLMFIKLEAIVQNPEEEKQNISRFIGQKVRDADVRKSSAARHIVKEFEPWKLNAVERKISPSIAFPDELLVSREEVNYIWDRLGNVLKAVNYAKEIPITTTPSFEKMRKSLAKVDLPPTSFWVDV